MTVPRNVIVDLLPLYLADEASPESRALVEAALRADPSLAAVAAAYRAGVADALVEPPAARLSDELELRTLRRTRRFLAWQRWLFGLAIGFTTVGLAIRVSRGPAGGTDVRLLLLDYPLPLGASLVAGAICWAAYAVSRRRVRV